jgi:hypothetical protein
MVVGLFFRRKDEVKVDLGDLPNEKEALTDFLRIHFKVESSPGYKGLTINSKAVSVAELEAMVSKFVSRQNLSATHWVMRDKKGVKIKRFEQHKKIKENKHPTQPAIITHGW